MFLTSFLSIFPCVTANILNDNKVFVNASKSGHETTILRLSITELYAPKWKPRQGIREIVQNWYDGVNEQVAELGKGFVDLLEETTPSKSVIKHTEEEIGAQKIDKYPLKQSISS
jgi:hypothetical protein